MKNLTRTTNTPKPEPRKAGADFPYTEKVRTESEASGVPEKVTHRPTLKRIAQMLGAVKK